MGHSVKSLAEVQDEYVYIHSFVSASGDILQHYHKLCLTQPLISETILEIYQDFVILTVDNNMTVDNMF